MVISILSIETWQSFIILKKTQNPAFVSPFHSQLIHDKYPSYIMVTSDFLTSSDYLEEKNVLEKWHKNVLMITLVEENSGIHKVIHL